MLQSFEAWEGRHGVCQNDPPVASGAVSSDNQKRVWSPDSFLLEALKTKVYRTVREMCHEFRERFSPLKGSHQNGLVRWKK